MQHRWKTLFRTITGVTGVCEALLGLCIVFFAADLQRYLATGALYEPLNLRILGMMDFYIGMTYVFIAKDPDKYAILNKGTCWLRLALSALFFAEGFWLLHDGSLKLIYQSLGFFDLLLFIVQAIYLKAIGRMESKHA